MTRTRPSVWEPLLAGEEDDFPATCPAAQEPSFNPSRAFRDVTGAGHRARDAAPLLIARSSAQQDPIMSFSFDAGHTTQPYVSQPVNLGFGGTQIIPQQSPVHALQGPVTADAPAASTPGSVAAAMLQQPAASRAVSHQAVPSETFAKADISPPPPAPPPPQAAVVPPAVPNAATMIAEADRDVTCVSSVHIHSHSLGALPRHRTEHSSSGSSRVVSAGVNQHLLSVAAGIASRLAAARKSLLRSPRRAQWCGCPLHHPATSSAVNTPRLILRIVTSRTVLSVCARFLSLALW